MKVESADHIVGGAEWSALSHDAFPTQELDFMLANPPYGVSWKKDLEAMGGKDDLRERSRTGETVSNAEYINSLLIDLGGGECSSRPVSRNVTESRQCLNNSVILAEYNRSSYWSGK